jgi:hypothetical protein
MPTRVDFKPNQRGWSAMANGPEAQRVVLDVAEHGRRWAETEAARFSPSGESPPDETYLASFEVVPGLAIVRNRPRVAGVLRNTSPHAAAVEWGNESTNGNGHRVLTRMLDALTTRRRRR